MSITGTVKAKLKQLTVDVQELQKQRKALQKKIDSKEYSHEQNQKFFTESGMIRQQIVHKLNAAEKEIKTMLDEYRKTVRERDRLHADQITDDAKLFGLGVILPVEEIQAIFDRNQGNHTMQRLAEMYADQHDIKLSRPAASYLSAEYPVITGLENTAHLYIDHWMDKDNADDMLDKFFGSES